MLASRSVAALEPRCTWSIGGEATAVFPPPIPVRYRAPTHPSGPSYGIPQGAPLPSERGVPECAANASAAPDTADFAADRLFCGQKRSNFGHYWSFDINLSTVAAAVNRFMKIRLNEPADGASASEFLIDSPLTPSAKGGTLHINRICRLVIESVHRFSCVMYWRELPHRRLDRKMLKRVFRQGIWILLNRSKGAV